MIGTPGSMRLSTKITSSAVMRPPVVAVHKRGASKGNIALDGAPRQVRAPTLVPTDSAQPVSDDTNLTVVRTSPDGMHLVVGDTKGVLRVYNLHSMKPLFKKELHSSPITTIEFSLVGEYGEILLATGAEDGSVSVMEVHNDFKIKLEKDDHEEPVTGISFSPGNSLRLNPLASLLFQMAKQWCPAEEITICTTNPCRQLIGKMKKTSSFFSTDTS